MAQIMLPLHLTMGVRVTFTNIYHREPVLSPCEFQQYLQSVLDKVPDSNEFDRDDLIMYSRFVHDHFRHLKALLYIVKDSSLKIMPKMYNCSKVARYIWVMSLLLKMGNLTLNLSGINGRPSTTHIKPHQTHIKSNVLLALTLDRYAPFWYNLLG